MLTVCYSLYTCMRACVRCLLNVLSMFPIFVKHLLIYVESVKMNYNLYLIPGCKFTQNEI